MQMAVEMDDLRDEQRRIAEIIGVEAYLELTREFGGTTIYIAKAEEIKNRIERDKKIREEFDGSNARELALKYGLSEVWIRNIVCDKLLEIRRKPIDGQIDLFQFMQNP